MKNICKTKIIATIGPSSWDENVLSEMILSGMDGARINASFADEAEILRVSNQIRSLSPKISLILDLQGYKIRVTGLNNEIEIKDNIDISSVQDNVPNTIQVTYPNLPKTVEVGTKIMLDDGNIQLEVREINGNIVHCTVLQSGILKPNKTVNIPGVRLDFPSITEKDNNDIFLAIENNFDYISASFVRRKEDILKIKEIVGNRNIGIIAKIENQEGLDNFDEILQESDAIMIARGDLGVEVPFEKIPIIQKQLIYRCRSVGKPVIVATQMLESMRENIQPTRAEISDVSNAIMDGADALMLSAETSTGKYPVESIAVMQRIASEAETVMQQSQIFSHTNSGVEVDELCRNVCDISTNIHLRGIIVISNTGNTVRSLSRHRPDTNIWEISNSIHRLRRDNILFGVKGFFTDTLPFDRDECTQKAIEIIYSHGELDLNDKIAIISGSSIRHNKSDAILEIVNVKDVLTR